MKIPARWKLFVAEYVKDFRGTQAAIRAGYSAKSAKQQASRHLARPEVQAYIAELMKAAGGDLEITAARTIKEIARLAFHDIGSYFKVGQDGKLIFKELTELTADQRAAIAEYDHEKRTMKLYNKDPSLDKLGKHFKLFTELHEVEHTFTVMPTITRGGKKLIFNVGSPRPTK